MRRVFILSILVLFFFTPFRSSAQINDAKYLRHKELYLYVGEVSSISLQEREGINHITWESSNEDILTIESKTGRIKALKGGEATVFCKYNQFNKRYKEKFHVVVKQMPIFFTYKIVAHALGGLEGVYTYSNSLEGLEQSTSKGYKLLETDIILTSDNRLVCFHGWNKKTYQDTGIKYNESKPVMTYDEFMKTKIQGKFTTIDLNTIIKYMIEHQEVYFEFDLRTLDKITSIKTAKALINEFKNNMELFDRIVIQVGSSEMYEGINSVYHFKNYQYFLHKSDLNHIDKVLDWVKEKGILSVAVSKDIINDQLIINIKQLELYLLVHTVDDVNEAKILLNKGVNIICTNFITYQELDELN